MFLARITGSVVSTQKVESMVGQKLLIVEPLRVDEVDQSSLKPTGRTFVVVDTVGAGDAFSAALALGMLAGYDLDRLNDYANRVAAFVCSRAGATPPIPDDLRIPA